MIIRPLQFALACLIFGSTLQAQSIIPIQKSASFWQPQKKEFHPTGEPTASHPTPTLQPHFQKNTVGFRTETEQIIGNTVYDLQTNATMMNRLFRWPDGQMSVQYGHKVLTVPTTTPTGALATTISMAIRGA
ncbi:MAG: hypothetical protein R2788_00585 [Saprospiraceae bacterium]